MADAHMVLYRTIWRWHFYAGLAVMPFMVILAISGAIYLFNDEINDALHPDTRFAISSGADAPLSKIAASALAAYPGGKITRIDAPTEPGRTYQVFMTPADGDAVRVFVDPASAKVQGSIHYPTTLVGISDQLHGSLFMGNFGDAIVEVVACWGLILVCTGLYLWWPRGQTKLREALFPKAHAHGRSYWKSLHASVGVWSALLIVFLILTGLPWATVWGGMFRKVTASVGIGYPASVRSHGAPDSTSLTVKDVSRGAAPWTLEDMPAPTSGGASGEHAGHHAHEPSSSVANGQQIDLDKVRAVIAASAMTAPYRLAFPADAKGVFSAYTYPDQPEGQRSIYIDQYSGAVIRDVSFQDYGIAAKAVELGVQIHMGNYFGRINQLIMLIPCIGIVLLAITGPYMWWQRRPKGTLAAPKSAGQPRLQTLLLALAAICILFPLAGASLLVVLSADKLLQSRTMADGTTA